MTAIVGGTWTYSGSPATSTLDQVRFLITDTDERYQKISDEEILWTIQSVGNYYSAAAICCRLIAVDRDATTVTVGDMSESRGLTAGELMTLADNYERRAALVGSVAVPFAGGVSVARKRENATDADRMPTRATLDEFSYRGPAWRRDEDR